MARADAFGARVALPGVEGIDFYRLARLHDEGVADPSRLPVTVRILLENLLRHGAERYVDDGDVEALARWSGGGGNAGVRPHSSGEGWRGGAPPTTRVSAWTERPQRGRNAATTGLPGAGWVAEAGASVPGEAGEPVLPSISLRRTLHPSCPSSTTS